MCAVNSTDNPVVTELWLSHCMDVALSGKALVAGEAFPNKDRPQSGTKFAQHSR